MGVELRPLGVRCNIQCQYCYQNPQRDAGNVLRAYDLAKMKAAVEEEGGPFTLFGGEPLLLPLSDLEELWAWGCRRYGRNSLQTNGVLITDEHVRLFKQYRVHVGISIDGPGELNDVRWAGNLRKTREATAKTEAAIARLCREGIPPALIVTLHRGNAAREQLPRLHAWMRELEAQGVAAVRLHLLEVDHGEVRARYALSSAENVEALLSFARLEAELTTLHLDLFAELRDLLLGRDETASCIWGACDPYTTRAVRGVEGDGARSNCGRTNKEGIDFVKAGAEGFERYLALYQTPQEYGGCRGCRFFLMCKGQCPGDALDGDWRNRTEHCEVWMTLFEHLEARLLAEGVTPLSVSPLRGALEQALMDAWAGGRNRSVAGALRSIGHPAAGQSPGSERS